MKPCFLLFLAAGGAFGLPGTKKNDGVAPLRLASRGTPLPNRYIATLKRDGTLDQHWEHIKVDLSKEGGRFKHLHMMNTYVVTVEDNTILDRIRSDPGVEKVEEDTRVKYHLPKTTSEPISHADLTEPGKAKLRKRRNKMSERWTWTGRMISAGEKVKDLKLRTDGQLYNYDLWTNPYPGTGVDIYVVDSGVRLNHSAFATAIGPDTFDPEMPRAKIFRDAQPEDDSEYVEGETEDDFDGHGTHVASTAAGWLGGAAMNATVVSVKVLGSDGANDSDIARAIHDITEDHLEKKKNPPSGWKGSVITMSLGGEGFAEVLDTALKGAYDAGITLVAAAGNENVDANNTYPCSFDYVICVGGVDINYEKMDISNYGEAVDILAPGEAILGADVNSPLNYIDFTGTSMATPAVAGMIANFLSYETDNLRDSPEKCRERLLSNALRDVVTRFPAAEKDVNGETVNFLATTGINHPNRKANDPFVMG